MGFFKGFAGGLSQGIQAPDNPFAVFAQRKEKEEAEEQRLKEKDERLRDEQDKLIAQYAINEGDWRTFQQSMTAKGIPRDQWVPMVVDMQKKEMMQMAETGAEAGLPAGPWSEQKNIISGNIGPEGELGDTGFLLDAYQQAVPGLTQAVGQFDIEEMKAKKAEELESINMKMAAVNLRNAQLDQLAKLRALDEDPEIEWVDHGDIYGRRYDKNNSDNFTDTGEVNVSSIKSLEDEVQALREGKIAGGAFIDEAVRKYKSYQLIDEDSIDPAVIRNNNRLMGDLFKMVDRSLLKLDFTTTQRNDNTEIYKMLHHTNKAMDLLSNPDVANKLGRAKTKIEDIKIWMNLADDDPEAMNPPAEWIELGQILGFQYDQMLRSRTGAAAPDSEKAFFQMLMGSLGDQPHVLAIKMDGFFRGQLDDLRGTYLSAINEKHGTDTAGAKDAMEALEGILPKPTYDLDRMLGKAPPLPPDGELDALIEKANDGDVEAQRQLEAHDIEWLMKPVPPLGEGTVDQLMSFSQGLPPQGGGPPPAAVLGGGGNTAMPQPQGRVTPNPFSYMMSAKAKPGSLGDVSLPSFPDTTPKPYGASASGKPFSLEQLANMAKGKTNQISGR